MIYFTGLRPREKLYEELLIDAKNVEKIEYEWILKPYENYYNFEEILLVFADFEKSNQISISKLKIILNKYVDSYNL